MEWLIALITLSAMEVVLGIDIIIFISILCGRLPEQQRAKARKIGLLAALGTRILLLLSLSVVLKLTTPVFYLSDLGVPTAVIQALEDHPPAAGHGGDHGNAQNAANTQMAAHEQQVSEIDAVSWKDMILLLGGMFLIGKSVLEIHHKLEEVGHHVETTTVAVSFAGVISQIAVLDIIFSLDSVITAVGMANQIWVMIVAVIIAMVVMLAFAGAISNFVDRNPTIKILALSFLILIGVMLVAEGIGTHFNKGYIYFAMTFSLIVEMLNINMRADRILPSRPESPVAAAAPHS